MMADLFIIVDSTANVPPEILREKSNLRVVPLRVIRGQKVWLDGEFTNAELFRQMEESGFQLRTSQPSPGDFINAINPLVASGAEVIVITMTGGLSGTLQSARIAAEMIGKNVFVIDSCSTNWGMVKMALRALKLGAVGMTGEKIANDLRRMAAVTHTMFLPGTLKYLHQGGRIGGAAALFGSILQICPVLQLVAGEVAVLDKIRTRSRAVIRMVDELKSYSNLEYIGIVHIEALEEAKRLRATLEDLYRGSELTVTEGGTVLATHLGPGLLGLIFQERLVL